MNIRWTRVTRIHSAAAAQQNEQHAEEVARLRQEMVEAENAKAAAERRMKLEMDQLRTAMVFKVCRFQLIGFIY